jgi:hypothetical protein
MLALEVVQILALLAPGILLAVSSFPPVRAKLVARRFCRLFRILGGG